LKLVEKGIKKEGKVIIYPIGKERDLGKVIIDKVV
jgi:hypothetical protein